MSASEREECLEKICSAGTYLLSLINEILDLSKIEAGKMQLYLEQFDLERDTIATVEPLAATKNNRFEVEFGGSLRSGGDVTVESSPGKGSSFSIWLPAECSGQPQARSATAADDSRGHTDDRRRSPAPSSTRLSRTKV